MKGYLPLALCSFGLLCGCGGAMGPSGGPQVSLSASSLGFGTELVGGASEPLPVTVTNSGSAALDITNIVADANFAQTNTCAATLAPGANCTISVTFTPTLAGSLAGTLSISDNASGSPQKVSLTGVGSTGGGRCSAKGQQCGVSQFPPCCSGLTCVAASTRAFCE
jgi:hypothetical protein